VDRLIHKLREGPPAARVDSVERCDVDPIPHYESFEIRG
jgi:acylphosphatase